ncbi:MULTISPECIES: G5 domain-containing protein [Actinomyces]|uniref:G5 domain-containing protein n=1 Tax=Actinomyces respiraculi TaxID=2744574 RepID=A0A7T0LKX7_9ACTO|nr:MULTISPECIES: G5 domain-containing protein [Actinomyces]QPL05656.1 G5 domain-containing protein [Actinomyces respiraculi]
MGRHSDAGSANTTLANVGALARRSLTRGATNTPAHRSSSSHRGSSFRPRTSPAVLRASSAAAALALAVSGGAYAAVQVSASDVRPLSEAQARMQASGARDVDGETSALSVAGGAVVVTTVTEDQVQAHTTVERETDALASGQRKVETEGVDGLTRVTYQVVTEDGVEVSREEALSVVVTAPVEEVVLVGTGPDPQAASAGSGTAAVAVDGSAASAQAAARDILASRGWDDSQFQCLVSLWQRESGWNYQAQNPSSGAYGIPQALPGSKMGTVAADWATNPVTQITWGLQYIEGRYGSPCNAWAHSNSVGWY